MKKLLVLLLTLSVAMGVFAEGPQERVASEELTTFTILNGAEPPTLDPSLSEDTASSNILMGLFEGLLIYDPQTNDGIPGMAESWTVSEDGKQWTFKLRKATWSDGVPIVAQTVVDSWLRTLDPATASTYAFMLTLVVEGAGDYNSGKAGPEAVQIRALDTYTFQMDLTSPAPYVTSMLPHSAYGILPMHVIKEHGEEWVLPENMVSNGPYVLKEWIPQDRVVVEKNEKYWDADEISIDRIVYIPSDDNNTRYNMFLNGEADWMNGGIPLDQIDVAKLRPDYQGSPAMIVYFYEINHEMPPFDDVRVRKALAMAVDRQLLVDRVTRGGQIPANNIVPPMKGYSPARGNPFNVEKAQQLLAEAGYPGGEGFPKRTILYNTSEGHKKIAEFVQQQWERNLGIEVEIENVEWGAFLDRGANQDFDIFRIGWQGDYLDANTFLELFQSDAGMNYGKYNNPKFDELIEKAASMKGGPERYSILRQAEQILIDQDQAFIPFYFYVTTHLIDTEIWGGWNKTVTNKHPPKFIYKK